jgi:hypothetical protein
MKGQYTLDILKALGEIATNTTDILRVVIEHPNRKALITESRKNLDAIAWKREVGKKKREEYFKQLQRYKNLIAWLRREGMIKELIIKNEKRLFITAQGKKHRELLIKRQGEALPNPEYVASWAIAKHTIIIAFDIPEKEKRKRAWLRNALGSIGFRMIQKSVWIGSSQLPQEFLNDLHKLQILKFVEIFKVIKADNP